MLKKQDQSQKKRSRLRRRWLASTISVITALGLVCVLAVTASFASFYYSDMEADLREYSAHGSGIVSAVQQQGDREIFETCQEFVRSFKENADIEQQFVDVQGRVAGASDPDMEGTYPGTHDIEEAIRTRGTTTDVGKDAGSGRRVMAVSCPVIYSSGEVAGVMRYVTSTQTMDKQILHVFCLSMLALVIVAISVAVSNMLFIRSVMGPVTQINEKARRIANGSYGVQIKTRYDDEIGELAETINELSAKIAQNEKIQAE